MKKSNPIVVKFLGRLCTVEMEEYTNGKACITLYTKHGREPWVYASVNAPEIPMKNDEIAIKNYSENAGVLDVLIEAGVLSRSHWICPYNQIDIYVCKLLCKPDHQAAKLLQDA